MRKPTELSIVALVEASLLLINLLSQIAGAQQEFIGTRLQIGQQQNAPVYERVVWAGSNISIGCPHFSVSIKGRQQQQRTTTTTWLRGTTLSGHEGASESRVAPEQKDTTLSRAQQETQRRTSPLLGHSRVKWFRNHVPLVNLNHLHYGCCDNDDNNFNKTGQHGGTNAQMATTIKRATELNQPTELSEASAEPNSFGGRGTRAARSDEGEDLSDSSGLHAALSRDFEITRENVNERVAVSRKGSNLQLKEEEEDEEREPSQSSASQWYVNKFGELLISRVSADFAGKYTCLVLGKQSDVLLHVLAVAAGSSQREIGKKEQINQSVHEEPQDEVGSVRSSNWMETNSVERANVLALEPKLWLKAPIQNVRIESIQLSDLKFIPGLMYSKQNLHCPIWRSSSTKRDFISTLGQTLCSAEVSAVSSEQRTFSHLRECQQLVSDFFLQMDTLKGADIEHITSILELAWFKDGRLLEFDSSTGKGTIEGPTANVRLINFCDQLDTTRATPVSSCEVGVEKQKEEPSDKNRTSKSSTSVGLFNIETLSAQHGPIPRIRGRRVSWMRPSIGRTLEIDGVRQDSAGHFSCAFKLSTLRLHRYILDRRQRVEQQQQLQRKRRESIPVRAYNISCCEERQSVKTFQLPAQPGDASTDANETTKIFQSAQLVDTTSILTMEGPAASNPTGKALNPANGNEWINLSKLIAKGLERRLEANQATNHTDSLAGFEKDPMAVIQTFSLVVLERSAKTCDIWSTITEAANAYSRRKWLNFRRLKRNRWLNIKSSWSKHDEGKQELDRNSLPSSELPPMRGADAESLSQPSVQEQPLNANSSHGLSNSIGPEGVIAMDEQRSQWASFNSSDHRQSAVIDRRVDQQPERQQQQQQSISFIDGKQEQRREHPLLQLDDKWRLNNADDESELDNTSASPRQSSFGRPAMAHETPFNYANERPAIEQGANKNGIMGTNGGHKLARSKRSSTVESGGSGVGGIDISSSVEIKELITQIGRAPMMMNSHYLGQNSAPPLGSNAIQQQQQNESQPELAAENVRVRQAAAPESRTMTADDGPPGVIRSEAAVGGPPPLQFENVDQWRGPISRLVDRQRHEESMSETHRGRGRPRREALTSQRQEVRSSPDDLNTDSAQGDDIEERQSSYFEGSDGAAGLDDDLMWIAGQYLYMGVKAVAGSPLFGAEVSVEWSNERVNGTNSYAMAFEDSSFSPGGGGRGGEPTISSGARDDHNLDYGRVRDTSPFATIDVIPGQNLHLQCTAHALGRLPEVKWYKMINDKTIPRVKQNLTRRIDEQLYWPLEDLDLLEIDQQTNFVQSQSTTLFNNLVTQTFTVVSNLQLGLMGASSSQSRDDIQNLFACIVDADVRHNFVTIRVNFPIGDPPINRIPIEISKRLQAKVLFERNQAATVGKSREPRHLLEDSKSPPAFERSFWIALGNGSNQIKRSQDFAATATTLSIMIVVVFGSLLGLVFLTLKSYQKLTSMQFEYSLDDYIGKETDEFSREVVLNNDGDEPSATYMMIDYELANGNSRCACQFDPMGCRNDLDEEVALAHMCWHQSENAPYSTPAIIDRYFCSNEPAAVQYITSSSCQKSSSPIESV